jgi:hypothetical protein
MLGIKGTSGTSGTSGTIFVTKNLIHFLPNS